MRLSRIIGPAMAMLAMVGTFAVAGSPAQAQPLPQPPYPPQPPTLTTSSSTVVVGEVFTVFGTGFGGNEPVQVTFTFAPLAAPVLGTQRNAAPNSGGVGAMLRKDGWTGKDGKDGEDGKDGRHPVCRRVPNVYRDPQVITVRANVTGNFQFRVQFCRSGQLTITARGLITGRTASTTVTVLRQHHPHPLPVTGSSTGSQITLGATLLAVGVLLVLVAFAWRAKSRRRGRSRVLSPVG
ncbi:hypothetical protein O7626_15845 [Micromonospora sp. WMMD1102]|uniref:hypothetical protein n=1 Tax=Micromonospora sp. WMMD1102 TaxID=3016105 RepID=UPI0024155DC4|nr:hypothetical protein [Micromonospora sp. WMMD1102]MDG4787388.1 hypothetical protein [Micromonospora sp. WMMD1102]